MYEEDLSVKVEIDHSTLVTSSYQVEKSRFSKFPSEICIQYEDNINK